MPASRIPLLKAPDQSHLYFTHAQNVLDIPLHPSCLSVVTSEEAVEAEEIVVAAAEMLRIVGDAVEGKFAAAMAVLWIITTMARDCSRLLF